MHQNLCKDNKEKYITFVDGIIHAFLPGKVEHPELYDLVKTYQLHRLSQTCRKYRNQKCRFNFGKLFSRKTIVAEPLPLNLSDDEKCNLLQKRQKIMDKVKEYINTYLNPFKS